jgi:hypothetical protein
MKMIKQNDKMKMIKQNDKNTKNKNVQIIK